jgi:predicted extracellular nuclease
MMQSNVAIERLRNLAAASLGALALAAGGASGQADAQQVFFNELHYDNTGTDAGEAIEIAGPAGTDLSGWSIVLYNGANGAVYNTMALSGVIPDQSNGIGTLAFNYPENGIQNGSPDGLALVDPSNVVVQFVSYEGTFTGVGGPADGMPTTDIGISETSSTPTGFSVQLTGPGRVYGDFSWTGPAASSFGAINTGQVIGVPPLVIGACGDPATLIHDVQGNGGTTPLSGQKLVIEGVVVGDFQSGLGGFYVQEEAADVDADPATSEGVLVVGGAFAVNAGDVVRVLGTANERFGQTALTGVSDVKVCAAGAAVAETVVTLPVADLAELEAREGMLVRFDQTLTISENFQLGRFGEVLLSNGRLPQPTQIAAPGAPANEIAAANLLNQVILDDNSNVQNPDPIVYPDPELTADNTLRAGDTVTGLSGILAFDFGAYRVLPVETPAFVHANPRADAPEVSPHASLKIASFNVLNFFNGDGQGGGFPTSRGADTAEEFARQKAKTVAALKAIDADIVGLIEIENDGYGPTSAIAELVSALNALYPRPAYKFINPGVAKIGTDEIAVGFIYKSAKVKPRGAARILDNSFDARYRDTLNRPALAQTFAEARGDERFTVVVNHFKSKGSDCNDVGDPDIGDGQGNCNLTRLAAAEVLAAWLATDPTGSRDSDFLIIGDLNSYAMEDPIRALEAGVFFNLVKRHVGDEAYSFVFDGQSGYLDHALANRSMLLQVASVAEWHINADEPISLDYNVEFKSVDQQTSLYTPGPYRSSDHDPVVVGLALGLPIAADFNGNGCVDKGDFWRVLADIHDGAPDDVRHDVNLDGVVDRGDVRTIARLITDKDNVRCLIAKLRDRLDDLHDRDVQWALDD